ncbi:hypothetical protein AC1031_012707 [Aphanomyces cochlioides]|nr:hypothetical protein AC1031_012707 [Aphanomyces cochlioides]
MQMFIPRLAIKQQYDDRRWSLVGDNALFAGSITSVGSALRRMPPCDFLLRLHPHQVLPRCNFHLPSASDHARRLSQFGFNVKLLFSFAPSSSGVTVSWYDSHNDNMMNPQLCHAVSSPKYVGLGQHGEKNELACVVSDATPYTVVLFVKPQL